MVQKTCSECGVPLGDVHGNTKYCERCRVKTRRERVRANTQRYRDQKKGGTLIHDNKRDQIDHIEVPEKNETEIIPAQHQFLQLLQRISGWLIEATDRLDRIEINQDELKYILEQDPEFRKRYRWRQRAIEKAIKLLQEVGEILPLYRIRQLLEEMIPTNKHTAEEILKQARERLQRQGDPGQSNLDDFDSDLEDFS